MSTYVGRVRNPSGLTMAAQREPAYSEVKHHKEQGKMPLISGEKAKSKEGFSKNVAAEVCAGKPQKQAVAIAYSQARKTSRHHGHRHKENR